MHKPFISRSTDVDSWSIFSGIRWTSWPNHLKVRYTVGGSCSSDHWSHEPRHFPNYDDLTLVRDCYARQLRMLEKWAKLNPGRYPNITEATGSTGSPVWRSYRIAVLYSTMTRQKSQSSDLWESGAGVWRLEPSAVATAHHTHVWRAVGWANICVLCGRRSSIVDR